jgi:hypothetical protein
MEVDLKQVDKSQVKAFFMFDLLLLPTLVRLGFFSAAAFILLLAIMTPFQMAGVGHGFFYVTGFLYGLGVSVFLITVGLPWLRIVSEASLMLFEIHGAQVPKRPVRVVAPPPAAAPAEAPKPAAPPSPAEPPKS